MAILESVIEKSYSDENATATLVRYCAKSSLVGYIGITSYKTAADEMQLVKTVYGKTTGRQARHYILSFARSEPIVPSQALDIASQAAAYFADRYQVVYGIHTDTDLIHIHFIVNTVNYVTGKKFTDEYTEENQFRKHLKQILWDNYGFELY